VWTSELPRWSTELAAAAETAGEDVDAALSLAAEYGERLPQPGLGQTALRWRILAAVAAADLTPARVLEAHSDALAILAEAGRPVAAGSWGVFAAEAPKVRLDAVLDRGRWALTGTKPWCSLGDRLDHALVTAHVEGGRALFAVDLHAPEVRAESSRGWVARGLRTVTSGPVHFDRAPAMPVGEREWYLQRPGFAWGGMGVAACWAGGAIALRERLRRGAGTREHDDIWSMHLGAVDAAVHSALATLADAAAEVDAGRAHGPAGDLLALRVRAVVTTAVETTIRHVSHALGPAPLAFEETYARRIADLELYVRQHHGERDLATLGATVAKSGLGNGF
jgi:alkylation response protein AidB-like acyl-CoA dehydrogenase